MKKLLVLMLAVLTAVTSPEQFKVNYICPRQYRLCFLHGRFTRRGDCAVMAAPTFVETTMHAHRGFFMPVCPA